MPEILKKQKTKDLPSDFICRDMPNREDCVKVRELLEGTGFFSDEELQTAVELIEEKLMQGDASTYQFVFAEHEQTLLGYTCYGLIPLTQSSYDLYWIGVNKDYRGYGIGKKLLKYTENLIKNSGGTQLYSETSSRQQYLPTRKFYLSCGYRQGAYFPDFYCPGDGKIIFLKNLEPLIGGSTWEVIEKNQW